MSKSKYLIGKKAIEDLEEIWKYTLGNWSIEQADRYYNLIINEIEFVADNYKTGKSIEHIRKDYRVTKIKSHLIFYRMGQNNKVEIIRILHQKMDVEHRIKE